MIDAIARSLVGSNDIHGSARWANWLDERSRLNLKNPGWVIDARRAISMKQTLQHLGVVTPTGLGKTSLFTMPNIIRQKFKGSIVVIDPSSDIFKETAPSLAKQGANVRVIQPFSGYTDYYNPFDSISTLSDAKIMANCFIKNVESKGNPFWSNSARAVLSALIYGIMLSDGEKTPGRLKQLLSLDDEGREEFIDKLNNEYLSEEYSQYRQSADETKSGILSTAHVAIDIFTDENIRKLTSKSSFNFSELREKDTVLYISIPHGKIDYCSPFLAVFFKQMFSYLEENRGKNKDEDHVRIILEEFGNIGHIPDFSMVLTTLRKKNVAIAIVIQNINQIKTLYGNQFEDIFGGCLSKIFLPGLNIEDAKYASELLGKTTVEKKSHHSKSDSNTSQDTQRPLLLYDEIVRLKDNSAIYTFANKYPVHIKKITPYYKQDELSSFLEYSKNNEFTGMKVEC